MSRGDAPNPFALGAEIPCASPVIAGLQACTPDAHCEACGTSVVFQPPLGLPLLDLAIRCAFCLRIFCHRCSIEHFR